MAQQLGQVSEGTLVKINENGSPVQFYVAKQNYESGLNGTGRVLVVRKDTYDDRAWSNSVNAYASSSLDSWFNGTYKNMLDADIRSLIGTTKIRYTPGNGNNTVGTLERAIFALSLTELGQSHTYANTEGSALPIASTLRIAYRNGSATTQWTRSPSTRTTRYAWELNSNGIIGDTLCDYSYGSRPAFTLPSTVYVDDNGNVTVNSAPTAPASITVPDSATKGGSVAVSWAASTDAEGNLSGYTLQRSVNGGGFAQVYQGANTSFNDTAPANADTMQYRVQAYDTVGATSGWTTSGQFPVYGVPKLTVPPMVMKGQQATISWTAIPGADSYTLQRKANTDADWTQVYSGANLSYSETVGAWTSVQYRVQAVFDGTPGGWATSNSIQIVSASALVISGQDGDLGTLTNDVPYSISSDQTSPIIDVTVEVNGGEYTAFQATSGKTYKVGVLDLPTGTGSIVITASAEVSDSPVTVTRTWTYSKTAQTFPNSGSVATLTKEGNVVYPETLVEAVRASMTPWGGNLSTALNLLKNAALFNRTSQPKYSEVTVSLSGKTEGQTIQLPENGRMVEFYVAKLDYESALNGAGRVLLVRKDCYDQRAWDSGNVNAYATSDIDAWMNSTYKALFPEEIQTAMGTTEFYYTPGNGNTTVTTLERAVFLLSCTELGGSSTSNANTEGETLPIYSILRAANLVQFTRSPYKPNTTLVYAINTDGENWTVSADDNYGSRPCFTLPSTFTYGPVYVAQDGTIHASQEYTEAGDWLDVWGNAIPAVKIETGSYVGTGTQGAGSPNTLSFNFEPKIVFVSRSEQMFNNVGYYMLLIRGITKAQSGHAGGSNTSANYNVVSWDGNSVSWYNGISSGQQAQLNASNTTYYYVAIG